MATETENKPVVAGEEEKKVEAPAVEAAAAAAPAAADKPAEAAAAAGGGDTAADKKPEEKADAAPAAGGEGGDGATSSDAAAAPAKKEKEMKPTVHKANFEKDVVYLYQFTRTPMLPSISPFCLKVETWLRLAGLKYENIDHKLKLRSKKGQLPFVEVNGEEIADSTIIMQELATRYDKDLDAALTQEQRNIAHAMISMLENHLVWVVLSWRSKNTEQMLKGYKINLQHALGSRLPNALLNFFFKFQFSRKCFQGAKKVKAQGLGVHKPEEIEEFGRKDLKVLSELLADKPFFFGDEPTTLDCVAFSVLAQIHFILDEVKYGLKEFMQENCPNLVGHVSRIKERCFPDWEDICTKLDLNAHIPKPEPETKENKEGADTEKTAEQDKNESEKELEKDNSNEKSEKKEEPEKVVEENKEKEEAAAK
ncbi:failed axon connections isoform X1 [Anopheles arabiensis]|uniref:failed axon connections isoform X1 n=1 Tax=Anopheles arabiensis TaxID=7173 RepID=UPI001AAD0CB6|nr:failed axon connections isoform X1 [Anopheles arabiensis]XP_040162646.1 failed axon connections isoform X1 [Anopheles arabiensis]XP_061509295.1 failed axon connections isoform X1 [Anopheles gambiae]XP_061509296.1 failed axon connections isoform X1 [Anopheles gambiae]XP_061509297.1 failed axon connections isoform X1 [Anopheles gambiae]